MSRAYNKSIKLIVIQSLLFVPNRTNGVLQNCNLQCRYTLRLILFTLLSVFISNCSVIGAATGKLEDKYSDSTTKEDEYAARGLAKDMSFIKSVVTEKIEEDEKRARGKITEYKDEEKELSNETEEAIDAYLSMEKENAIKCSQNTDIKIDEYLSNDCWLSEIKP